MRKLMHIFAIVAPALLVIASLAVVPARAQEVSTTDQPANTREVELRDWFNNLPEHRQKTLKRRLQALKRLPKDKQKLVLERAQEGKPVLSEDERAKLRKLRTLPYLKRVKLYTLGAELRALRHSNPGAVREAMKLEGRERARRLAMLINKNRMSMFVSQLSEPEREAIRNAENPMIAARDAYREASAKRMETLVSYHPRVRELREMAEKGDATAKRELRSVMTDLHTLSLLMMRLSPERQEEVMAEIRDLSIDRSADTIRKALQKQWREDMKNKRRNRAPGDRNPGDRKPTDKNHPNRNRRG